MITNLDMGYHPEAMAHLTTEATRYKWAETVYMPFAVPSAGLFGSLYLMSRPGLGVITSDVKIFQGLERSRFRALYLDNQSQLPAPKDFRRFTLPTGMTVDLTEGPARYQFRYVGVNDTTIELVAEAIMPAYDIHDPEMDPMARPNYEEGTTHSGYGAAYGGHYDQLCRIVGRIRVRGQEHAIDYVDCMDRSWGVRGEIGLQPMAWNHAIFDEHYAFHAIWSLDYAAAEDAQHQFAHGFVLENGVVYGCTAASIRVARDDVWPVRYEIMARDRRGIEHKFSGTPVASGLWEPYGCCGVPNVLCRYAAEDGRLGYGESQEAWFYDRCLGSPRGAQLR